MCKAGAADAFSEVDLVDLNVLLHRADGEDSAEERDATGGEIGTHNIPGMGSLVHCSLEGWMHPIRHITKHNDLGHPLCGHLCEGSWAMEYITSHLERQVKDFPRLAKPIAWFQERFDLIKRAAPPFLRPKYFAIVIVEAYKAARCAVVKQSSEFVSSGHNFTHSLALASVRMHGRVKSALLDPNPTHFTPSLAAGLPHFSAGWARCWGRDIFISPRGLFLTTGNFPAPRCQAAHPCLQLDTQARSHP